MNLRFSKVAVAFALSRQPLFRIPKFEAASGARLLIHGPSGRGKTTLLHLMAGLLLPNEGDTFVGDQNLRFLSDEQRCRLRRQHFGIIFQRLNLLDHLTAVENVRLLADSADEQKALAVLEELGLRPQAHQRTAQLSLGEQQRVAVARAVLAKPSVLLADEPTSSLDARNADAVIEALLGLPGKPTIVVVSHDARIRSRFAECVEIDALIDTKAVRA